MIESFQTAAARIIVTEHWNRFIVDLSNPATRFTFQVHILLIITIYCQ